MREENWQYDSVADCSAETHWTLSNERKKNIEKDLKWFGKEGFYERKAYNK